MRLIPLILIILVISSIHLQGQDPCRFESEINAFNELPVAEDEEVFIFTGSSSVRLWEDLATDCDEVPVINTGFGGSHMSDLFYFLDQAVTRFRPVVVYIYEGDNDISAEKNPKDIITTTKAVVSKLLALDPQLYIHFIAAKPSPSRWKYKAQYEAFNGLLKDYCNQHPQLFYIDVWHPMLDAQGRPMPDIFISDSLHMNRKGYLIWKDIICGNKKN